MWRDTVLDKDRKTEYGWPIGSARDGIKQGADSSPLP